MLVKNFLGLLRVFGADDRVAVGGKNGSNEIAHGLVVFNEQDSLTPIQLRIGWMQGKGSGGRGIGAR